MNTQFDEMDLVYDMDDAFGELDQMQEDEGSNKENQEQRKVDPAFLPSHDSAGDALIASIRKWGKVDLEWMTKQSGLDVDALIDALDGRAIFQDPDKLTPNEIEYPKTKGWVLAANYLNGNLRHKLLRAQSFNKQYPGRFERNIKIIQERIPRRVSIDEIHIPLGATWIPADFYADFINELLSSFVPVTVSYDEQLGSWKVKGEKDSLSYIANFYNYGTYSISALKIIEQTMNAKTVKVYDRKISFDEDGNESVKSVLNPEKTQEAQDKQKLIIEEFNDWCMSDFHRAQELENAYNEEFSAFGTMEYDGSFLEFPDLNPDIHLYPHQTNAIARILLSDENVLLAHEVGTGKTYEMICSAHELKRLGLARKILITMPNQVFTEFLESHELLYPHDSLLIVRPSDFAEAKRQKTLERIRNEDYVVCYMPHSVFDRIKMSRRYWIAEYRDQVAKLQKGQGNRRPDPKRETRIRALKKNIDNLLTKEYQNIPEGIMFDELGFDTLFVDEAHKYKNIPLEFKADNIVGMHSAGSAKCKEMLEKCKATDRIVFATGTPLTNSLADLFVLQTYLQPEELKDLQISYFDQWVNTFAQRETNIEVDIDSSSLRPVTRFSTFHNIPELMSLFTTVCDFHYKEKDDDSLPDFHGYSDIRVAKTTAQARALKKLAKRTDDIRKGKYRKKGDNLLKITYEGRMVALDIRLLDLKLPKKDQPMTKISICADNIIQIARDHPGCAQLVFSDIGVPKNGFNVYDELKAQLISRGMPNEEIAYIHDARTETARSKLFKDVNAGKIRVIIGSTEKLGTGVNIQERLIALHHLSVPWRPADMVQREGRILRQGNTCDEVFIYRYVTKGTFDSYSWQLLENKQRFISSFLAGSAKNRSMEDISNTVLSYAELKALAIGNPLIKRRVETANKLEKTRVRSRQRASQLNGLVVEIDEMRNRADWTKEEIETIKQDIQHFARTNKPMKQSERIAVGEQIVNLLNQRFFLSTLQVNYKGFVITYDSYRFDRSTGALTGYNLNVRSEQNYEPLHGTYRFVIERLQKPLGIVQSLDYLLSHLTNHQKHQESALERLKGDIESAKAEIEQGNSYLEQIEELEEQLAQIDEKIEEQSRAAQNAQV